MPNSTVNFALPYPAGTDAPCDFAQQWCDFTGAIDTVLDTFQAAIDRTIPLVPVAILQQTVATSIGNGNPFRFDTVLIDTGAMTDIDADPFAITIRRPGRYTVAATAEKPTVGAPLVPTESTIFILPKSTAQSEVIDRGAGGGVVYLYNAYCSVETYAAGDRVRLAFSVGTAGSYAITRSWLSVLWHSDTEAP